jgi:hypothetical protein
MAPAVLCGVFAAVLLLLRIRISSGARMIRCRVSACIDAATGEVWDHLARLEDISLWSEAIVQAVCDGERSRGVGAERTCRLTGGVTIRERWLEWDEGRGFVYEGLGVPMVAKARNRWTVLPVGAQTLLVSEAEVSLKSGTVGRFASRLVAWQIRRVGQRTLAAFKYLVEEGEPPRVRHARLPAPAALC